MWCLSGNENQFNRDLSQKAIRDQYLLSYLFKKIHI